MAPGAFDVFSALLIERSGFDAVYLGGYSVAHSAYGLPDAGLVGPMEFIEVARRLVSQLSIPLIMDLDDGGGGPRSVYRAVSAAADAGVAAVQIEDSDLSAGKHLPGREIQLKSMDIAVANIESAVRARHRSDIVVIARTDALHDRGIEDAVDRSNAFLNVGADMVYAPYLNKNLIDAFVGRVNGPVMHTFGGETEHRPSGQDLRIATAAGVRLVAYPANTLWAAHRAVARLLDELKATMTVPVEGYEAGTMEWFAQVVRLSDWFPELEASE